MTRRPVAAWNVIERRLGVPYPLWNPTELPALTRLVRRADLVHLHDSLYLGNVAAFSAARRCRKPAVVTQHVGDIPYANPFLRAGVGLANRTLARWVLGGCRRAVFISTRVRAFFDAFVRFRSPPLFIPNGVDGALFRPTDNGGRAAARRALDWPEGRPVALFVGRFVEKKGLNFLRELCRAHPQWLWAFAGAGVIDPRAWGLPNVRVLGRLPHDGVVTCYQGADVLVLPSVGEGFPLVVQEAMSCGLPALVAPETADAVPDLAGAVTSAELRLDAWGDRLREFESVPSDGATRNRTAEFARRWDWDRCADLYERLFREVCGGVPQATTPSRTTFTASRAV